MAKWYGKIGYVKTAETTPGKWEEVATEVYYAGDVITNPTITLENGEGINNNINVTNQISVIADPYAFENLNFMKYIEFYGVLWNIKSVSVAERPRLLISLGGEYINDNRVI